MQVITLTARQPSHSGKLAYTGSSDVSVAPVALIINALTGQLMRIIGILDCVIIPILFYADAVWLVM
ncbi:hypothetical protein [Pectobacterium polaris]|uniref:hypothetical protein n=1 Tax=Pectobacterium polaris TaxID=2042057 RepID=UPI001968D92A|nr:hypothetical protein [Pectobacterium polaris]MBN3214792.1 hypothetical protein [Pectobacterium polaris]